MQKSDLTLLFAYNRWANARILEAARTLSIDQLTAPAQVSYSSLLGTIAHILSAETIWRTRLQEGISPTYHLTEKDFPNLEALETVWREEEEKMRKFVESLTEEDPQRWVAFHTTSGKPEGITLWRGLAHVVNHGTQFRSEAGVVLTILGRSPGDLDLLYYLRQTDQR